MNFLFFSAETKCKMADNGFFRIDRYSREILICDVYKKKIVETAQRMVFDILESTIASLHRCRFARNSELITSCLFPPLDAADDQENKQAKIPTSLDGHENKSRDN